MSVSPSTKRRWFDLGASAFERAYPGALARQFGPDVPPQYVCPICAECYPRAALSRDELTADHVPAECLGGHELVLTCKACNSGAGAFLEAHARRKEDVLETLAGRAPRPQPVKVTVGSQTLNAWLFARGREFGIKVPPDQNRPGAGQQLADDIQQGFTTARIDFHAQRFNEVRAKVTWLRSAYLALFAVVGYPVVFDPAMDIVRRQIRNPKKSLIVCFTIEIPGPIPESERRIVKVHEPAWCRGIVVQFGHRCVLLPNPGDTNFYTRVAENRGGHGAPVMLQFHGPTWPIVPTFGLIDRSTRAW